MQPHTKDHWTQYTITVSAHQATRRFTSNTAFQTSTDIDNLFRSQFSNEN